MIKKLILKNWKSHENTEFEFSSGTNVIVGQMGSGKSSSMDAICFALFGTFPALQSKKVKIDDIIMSKPQKKDSASVEVVFRLDNNDYSIIREIKKLKGTVKSELRKEGKLVEGPNTQRVTEQVCSLLKMDYELFSRAVYSDQNNLEYFLEIPKGKRKDKIDELLRITRLEDGRKNLHIIMNKLEETMKSKREGEKKLDGLEDSEQIKKEINVLNQKTESTNQEIQAIEKHLTAVKNEYQKVADLKQKHDEIERNLKETSAEAAMLKKRINSLEKPQQSNDEVINQLINLKKELEDAVLKNSKKNELEKQKNEKTALLSKSKNRISQNEIRLKNAKQADTNEIRKRFDYLTETCRKTGAEILSSEKELKDIDDKKTKLNKKCPVCMTDLTNEKLEDLKNHFSSEKNRLTISINELNIAYKTMLNQIELAKNDLNTAIKTQNEIEWVKADISNSTSESKILENEIKQLEKELENYKDVKSSEEIERKIIRLEKAKEYFDIIEQLKKAIDAEGKLKNEISLLKYDPEDIKKKYEELKEAEKTIAIKSTEVKGMTNMLNEKNRSLERLQKLTDDILKNKHEAEQLENYITQLGMLGTALQTAQGMLRKEFTESINMALKEVWNKIYPYKDYSDLRLGIDESGDYILQLSKIDGSEVNVENGVSGGEKSTACLALRIGLSLVLTQNLSWLVLDEPTHNLDKETIRGLTETLRERLPKIVEQIFVITHEEELENAASGSLYKLSRDKNIDEPTKIAL